MSTLAATVLRKEKLLILDDLEICRPWEYDISNHGPYEPVSGATWAVSEFLYESLKGMGEILSAFVRVPYIRQRKVWEKNQQDMHAKGKMREFDEVSVSSSITTSLSTGAAYDSGRAGWRHCHGSASADHRHKELDLPEDHGHHCFMVAGWRPNTTIISLVLDSSPHAAQHS
ncbi:hypothetical protein LTR70_005021 [Exophiala xenobiotica]|uniref:Uncharacterized protein n=1 Tax=Lithohypha guttulata TaxID=1690604 RepID=A0ABR0KDZ0_9EURO|nr:hypothetical protein LTR24_004425 [Lithohypha guttulata]KAK5319402.1 hypothetical protein LTR70_005021 [Exophiala xenobiotica]